MPLRNTEALRVWGEREDPPYRQWAAVEGWALGLDADPWQPPSTPWTLNQGEPSETRSADLEEMGVWVVYTVEHGSLQTDLVSVVRT